MKYALRRYAQNFRRGESGSIALMSGLFVSMLAPAVMATIDFANISSQKIKIQSQLDSAILVATQGDDLTRSSSDGTMQAKGERFLYNALIGAGIDPERAKATFTYDPKENKVSATVDYDAPSLFLGHVLEIDRLTLRAETTPREEIQVEIALALDVSGSMAFGFDDDNVADVGSRRIDALRDGVNQLLTTIGEEELVDPRFSVIPYSSSVDIKHKFHQINDKNKYFEGTRGKSLDDLGLLGAVIKFVANLFGWTLPDDTSPDNVKGVWAGERTERSGAGTFQFSARKPNTAKKMPVMTPMNIKQNCHPDNVRNFGKQCIDVVDFVGGNTSGLYVADDIFAPQSGVLALNKAETIPQYLESLEPKGGTAVHLGTAWALYSLLPDWEDLFNTPEKPAAETGGKTRKILVVMTDGDITLTHTEGMSVEDAYDYFQDVCKTARELGIQVYTLGLKASAKTDKELTECAGSKENYFPVKNRAKLKEAFDEIAKDAGKLYISK